MLLRKDQKCGGKIEMESSGHLVTCSPYSIEGGAHQVQNDPHLKIGY